MWKRDDAVKPTAPGATPAGNVQNAPTNQNVNTAPATEPVRSSDSLRGMEKGGPVNIGKSVVIKGELTGSEDLTIEGHVEGKIELRQKLDTLRAPREE